MTDYVLSENDILKDDNKGLRETIQLEKRRRRKGKDMKEVILT
jgi:hypothetical protein